MVLALLGAARSRGLIFVISFGRFTFQTALGAILRSIIILTMYTLVVNDLDTTDDP